MRYIYCGIFLVFSSLVSAETPKEPQAYNFEFAKKQTTKKPELADFARYNDFLQAMYLYQKNEEQTFKPDIVIRLPSQAKSTPESSAIEEDKDITSWGEAIPAPPLQD